MSSSQTIETPPFDPRQPDSPHRCARIGSGALGAKATGLCLIHDEILSHLDLEGFPETTVVAPRAVVVATDFFESFMERNRLWGEAIEDQPDALIARRFQQAELPEDLVENLRALVSTMRAPLALRPSSYLEEKLERPFPTVYTTKMIANNDPNEEARVRRLAEALKLVWASTFFAESVVSRRAAGVPTDAERMALVVQEIFGEHHGNRFYPTLSALARSFNYYPTPGDRPEDGAVSLALGLGKTIIDDGHAWRYCPQRPTAPPPFKSTRDLMKFTQTSFWAVNTGEVDSPDPLSETECLVRSGLGDAESDGTLKYLVSTYDPASDRLYEGLASHGPRVLTFAPLLSSRTIRFHELTQRLVEIACEKTGGEVAIELSANLDPESGQPMSVAFLQLRPMMGGGERFPVEEGDMEAEDVLVASFDCLGHGARSDLEDVVYLPPRNFDRGQTRIMASELEAVNRGLADEGRQAIFIGLGRWGTTDDRFGVPVRWGQISAARVIVEVSLPEAPGALSQGTHFFHRVLNFQVLYMSIEHGAPQGVDWDWLDSRPAVWDGRHVRHVRLEQPLEVRVDGTTRRGLIRHGNAV